MPRSVASRRASGDASTLPVAGAGAGAGAAGAGARLAAGAAAADAGACAAWPFAAAWAGAGAGFAAGAGAGLAGAGAGAAAAGLALPAERAFASSTSLPTSSPALPMIAIGVPTGTEAPSAIRRLSSTPSSNASKSITALSVSTSASTSPGETLSPSFFRHFCSTPIFIVSDSCGMSRIWATGGGLLFDVEKLLSSRDGAGHVGDALLLQVVVVRHGHVGARDALDRRVQVVEAAAPDAVCDLSADAVERPPFLQDQAALCLRHRLDEQLFIQRPDRPRVDDLRLDALGRQRFRRAQRDLHHLRPADDGDVRARALHLGDAQRNRVLAVRDLALVGVEHLALD